ncbi:MAG TPA: hypothetical protein VFJ13_01235, partial [Paracoccaceae bacterium]|nr:hypothetical protein [Paracoccaceae bacterium]
STYMVHYLVLLIMEKSELRSVIGFTAFVVLAMILIYTLSALSYHLWEQPMRRHVQRRGRKWVSPQSPEASSIVEPPLAR